MSNSSISDTMFPDSPGGMLGAPITPDYEA